MICKAYFPVFVGCLAGLAGLYARRRAGTRLRGADELDMEGWIFVATFVGLAVSLVGDVLE